MSFSEGMSLLFLPDIFMFGLIVVINLLIHGALTMSPPISIMAAFIQLEMKIPALITIRMAGMRKQMTAPMAAKLISYRKYQWAGVQLKIHRTLEIL